MRVDLVSDGLPYVLRNDTLWLISPSLRERIELDPRIFRPPENDEYSPDLGDIVQEPAGPRPLILGEHPPSNLLFDG